MVNNAGMDEADFISKTRRKRRMTELQDVGAALVKLTREQLAHIRMPDELREAVLDCKRFTRHEAVRRQLQYIGRLMREVDAAPLVEQLEALHSPSKRQTALFHVAERWRDELLGGPEALARFQQEFPRADMARVRGLIDAAHADRAAGRAPRRARELFHAVNDAVQEAAAKA